MIEKNLVMIDYREAMPDLKEKVNGYRRFWKRVYIGLTASPTKRWEKHERNGWNKMVLLYEAFTPQIGRQLERELIEYARKSNFILDVENIMPGGEGILDQNGYHYLYVLVG